MCCKELHTPFPRGHLSISITWNEDECIHRIRSPHIHFTWFPHRKGATTKKKKRVSCGDAQESKKKKEEKKNSNRVMKKNRVPHCFYQQSHITVIPSRKSTDVLVAEAHRKQAGIGRKPAGVAQQRRQIFHDCKLLINKQINWKGDCVSGLMCIHEAKMDRN